VISASYTDKGNPVTGPLTGRKLIVLRNPKVQAESYTQSANVDRKHQDGSNQSWVGDIKDGSYIGFNDIDLTGIARLEFNVAAMPSRGGRIEVHAGSPTGKLIGTANVEALTNANTASTTTTGSTGGGGRRGPQWQVVTAPITASVGPTDLFFVFRNDQVKDKNILIVDWMLFDRPKS
jgi:cytochrome c